MTPTTRIPLRFVLASAFVLFGTSLSQGADSGDGKNRHVIVRNDSSLAVYHFYASRVGIDDWQEDILGDGVIEPGHESRINVDDGSGYCHYDFRAVMSDGEKVFHWNVDVCTAETWTITD